MKGRRKTSLAGWRGNASLVLPPRRPPTVIHFNVARLSESLSASIETLSVDELQPGSDVANRGGRPITDYKHAACFFDWLGAAPPRTVKRCLAHGSQHVLWIMWMAHPNQADRPQGSHRVSDSWPGFRQYWSGWRLKYEDLTAVCASAKNAFPGSQLILRTWK